jgi:hypothetical protein
MICGSLGTLAANSFAKTRSRPSNLQAEVTLFGNERLHTFCNFAKTTSKWLSFAKVEADARKVAITAKVSFIPSRK